MTGENTLTGKELLHNLKTYVGDYLTKELIEMVLLAILEAGRDEHVGAGRFERGIILQPKLAGQLIPDH